LVVLLGVITLAYRAFSSDVPEVEVVRAAAETSSSDAGGTVLSATGYIVAHHTINVNSKVTGRLSWIGVEKGDKVKEGQVLVRLEDQEFRASYEQARGALDNAQGLSRRTAARLAAGRNSGGAAQSGRSPAPRWSMTS
jgi:multidrug efflux pump subunit AcrA (membrane-fusion protein)